MNEATGRNNIKHIKHCHLKATSMIKHKLI